MSTPIEGKVAAIIDDTTLVLNVGSEQGVQEGMAFAIFALQGEIEDPDSGESLGRWEVVKARVLATHVQARLCTVRSPVVGEVPVVGDTRPLSTMMVEHSVARASGQEQWQRLEVRGTDIRGRPQNQPIAVGDGARSLAAVEDDASQPAADDASKPAADDASQPAADDASQPAADDAGQPAADDASQPAADDASQPEDDARLRDRRTMRVSRPRTMRASQPIRVALAALCIGGCAYYSTSGGLLGGIRSIGIPVADNQTSEFAVAERLTERAIDAYAEDGQLRIVDEESADALLQLNVISIEDRPHTYTTAEQTEQYRFAVLVAAELVRVEDGEVLLTLAELEGWGTYDAAQAEEDGRDPAVKQALDMVLEELVDRTTAGW